MLGEDSLCTSDEGKGAEGPSIRGQLGERMDEGRVEVEKVAVAANEHHEGRRFIARCLGCWAWPSGRSRQVRLLKGVDSGWRRI